MYNISFRAYIGSHEYVYVNIILVCKSEMILTTNAINKIWKSQLIIN